MSARLSRLVTLPREGEAVAHRDVGFYVHRLPPGASQTMHWAGPMTRGAAEAIRDEYQASSDSGAFGPAQWLVVKVTTVTEVIPSNTPPPTTKES